MTQRTDKIDELIRQEIGKIVLKELDITRDVLFTITRAETSPDLKKSTIFFTSLPEAKNQDVLRELNINTFHIQKALNRKLSLKQIPKVEFKIDKQAIAEQNVFKLLKEDETGAPTT